MSEIPTGRVYFIGAGPGDPDLITVKGQKLLATADVVLYAGSLVPEEILKYAPPKAAFYNSAGMKLEQQVALMTAAARQGKRLVRLHTGDPSIFGAIDEQIEALAQAGIPYEIIPGVSSAFAAAAALGIEYTLPEITQTLILTRLGGRTPVPELERLRDLARHRSSLAIFLSTGLIASVVEELSAAGYPPETPVAVVYRASWPDQKVVRGALSDIALQLDQQELTHQGLIVVGPALRPERVSASHLYGEFQETASERSGTAILALTAPAVSLGRRIYAQMSDAHFYLPERFLSEEDRGQASVHGFQEAVRQVLQNAFQRYQALVCILASGIVVRELAPLLKNKHSDPAVVVIDPYGQYAISLLGGHEGGANRLAHRLAGITGGQAVITTASDHQDIPALDILAKEGGWKLHPRSRLAKVMAALVNGQPLPLVLDESLIPPSEIACFQWAAKFFGWEAAVSSGYTQLVVLTCRQVPGDLWRSAPDSVVYHLPALVIGVGCKRGAGREEIKAAIRITLADAGLALESVGCVATIVDKADEAGLVEACRALSWELRAFSRGQIQQVANLPNPSPHARNALGVWGVAEPAALLASGAARLLVEKRKFAGVTVAVAVAASTREKTP